MVTKSEDEIAPPSNDRFVTTVRWSDPSDCDTCAHVGDTGRTCLAFQYPGHIPYEIMQGEVSHKTPYPGDGGIQWAPKSGK